MMIFGIFNWKETKKRTILIYNKSRKRVDHKVIQESIGNLAAPTFRLKMITESVIKSH